MFALDLRRCPHCVRALTAFQLDEPKGKALRAPVLICDRCDGAPIEDEPLYLPRVWPVP
jgi:hypothetical protein